MSISRARLVAAFACVALGSACKEGTETLVPANIAALSPTTFNSVAGGAIAAASLPKVKVTTASGAAVPGTSVIFELVGGGSGGGTAVTDAEGIATVPGWTLGTTATSYVMLAKVEGIATPVTFTATGTPGPAAKLALTTAPSTSVANRAVFPTQPTITVQDANSNVVTTAGTTVTAAISTGGGTLQGTLTATTNASGVATFTNLAIAGSVGARTLSFTSSTLTNVTAPVTTTPGAAATIAKEAGDNQSALPSTSVPIPPAVKISDADGNGVSGVQVTFAVTAGGGSVQGATATSGSTGTAAVTSWTMGSGTGTNTLSATAAGLTGSPATFTATSTTTLVSVTAVSPPTLTSGVTATISGNGFSATPANNSVTIDGVASTVTAASATSLTVTVPSLPCTPAHSGVVSVTASGVTGTRNHPIQAGTAHTLSVGQSVVLSTATAARCNELHNANTNALYYVSVYNTNTTYGTVAGDTAATGSPAAFELKGTSGAASSIVGAPVVSQRISAARPTRPQALRRGERDERAHVDLLERDLAFLRTNAHLWAGRNRTARLTLGGSLANAVGDLMTVRLRNLDSTGTCNAYLTVNGRVAYSGAKAIIVEDTQNPVLNIDTTYAQIGQEFDNVMMPILETNYGNPLVNDAVLDNNGRFIMVFTDKIRTMAGGGVAGFVSPCDFFPRTTYASSNVGEYFYAIAPTVPGGLSGSGTPPVWRWSIRGTIIHEVKHIVSSAERFFRNGGTKFEESWLEESTARVSEELFERARYSFAQRANIGWGSAANPVGPYCGIRACNGQARGIVRVFEELDDKWYVSPHAFSPLGRINSSDFSFYATAWSLLRWTMDANVSKAESAILKGMTQEPTLSGVANFNNQMGMNFVDALPKWTMAMVLDDYPSFTPSDATLKQPSWNLRDVYAGMNTENGTYPSLSIDWPFQPTAIAFGAFSRTGRVRAGTAAIVQISGSQTLKQVIELKADGSSAAAPAELRMAIVRVQ